MVPTEPGSDSRLRLVCEPGGHAGVPRYLAFTPDGKKLISAGDDRTVQVWDVASGERLRVIRPPVGLDGQGGVSARVPGPRLVLDRQGERLAFCAEAKDDKGQVVTTTFVCSLATGAAQTLKRAGPRAFAPDGKTLAIGEGHAVRLVEIATDTPRLTANVVPARAKQNVSDLAFSPDGKTLAVVADDARVSLLDAATFKPRRTLTVPGKDNILRNVGWANDRTVVCRSFSTEKAVVVLDADTGELKHSYPREVLLSQLPKGDRAAFGSLEVIAGTTKALVATANSHGRWVDASFLLDWETGEAGKAYVKESAFGCHATAVAPDLSVAAQGDGELNDIILWDPTTGQSRKDGKTDRRLRAAVRGANGRMESIRWRPDGKAVVWEQFDGRGPAEFDLTSLTLKGRKSEDFKKYGQASVTLVLGGKPASKDDQFWHDSERGLVREWGPLTLKFKWPNLEIAGGPQPVTCETYGSVWWDYSFVAGGRVVSHPMNSHSLQVFDSTTGGKGPWRNVSRSWIQALAVSPRPECRYVLVGSADQTLTVFNPATAQVLLTVFPAGRDWIAWTPEGYYAATPGGEKLMGWQVENGPDRLASFYPAERFRKQMYRPDVIKLLLEKGSVEEALKAAGAAVADVQELLPPQAALAVTDRTGLAQGKVKLKATAEAAVRGQPVVSLRLLVDGRPLPDGQGVLELKAPKEKAEADWEVTLPSGPHELKVLARGRDTAGASAAVPVDVPLPAAGRPALHVIAVGIDAYPEKALRLHCAVNDARDLARAFREHCAGKDNLFGDVRSTTLLDAQATRQVVLAALKEARRAVKPGDLLVFSFAGHGARQGPKFYLLAADSDPSKLAETALSGDDLRAALAEMPCQVLLLLDACHSAAGVRAFIDEAARGLTDDETGVAVLCAAMGSEEAQEKDGHGLFTRAVLEALGETDGVPFNRHDRRQYVHHLGAFVQDEVKEQSHDEQHPFLTMPYVTESFPIRQLARHSFGTGE
jgi:WD40 repeat protein